MTSGLGSFVDRLGAHTVDKATIDWTRDQQSSFCQIPTGSPKKAYRWPTEQDGFHGEATDMIVGKDPSVMCNLGLTQMKPGCGSVGPL